MRAHEVSDHGLGEPAADVSSTGRNLANRRGQIGQGVGFENVRTGAGAESGASEFGMLVHGEHDDFHGGRRFAQALNGFDAMDIGQGEVENDDIGFCLAHKGGGFEAGGSFAADEHVGLGGDGVADTAAHDDVIVNNEDAMLSSRRSVFGRRGDETRGSHLACTIVGGRHSKTWLESNSAW